MVIKKGEKMSSKIIRLNKVRKYIAQMIRDYLMHKRALLKMDPQVPFPRNSYCFSSMHTWDCMTCEGKVYTVGFAGIMRGGGYAGSCNSCGMGYLYQKGIYLRVGKYVA